MGLSDGDPILGTYGDNDNLGGTPNVVVDYRSREISSGTVGSSVLEYWNLDYGDLIDVAYAPEPSGYYAEITLTADPGWEVVLNSFDLAGFDRLDRPNQPVFVVMDVNGAVLFDDSGTVLGTGATHSSYAPGLAAQSLTIRFGDRFTVGIDNVNFDQRLSLATVPEPASLGLFSVGLVGLAAARRWKRRQAA